MAVFALSSVVRVVRVEFAAGTLLDFIICIHFFVEVADTPLGLLAFFWQLGCCKALAARALCEAI
jgi:hypothetical protein